MNNNVLKISFGFSLIIAIIAIFLFYITWPTEITFIPIIISLVCAIIVSTLSIIFYGKNAKKDGEKVYVWPVMVIYFSVIGTAILVRTIIILVGYLA